MGLSGDQERRDGSTPMATLDATLGLSGGMMDRDLQRRRIVDPEAFVTGVFGPMQHSIHHLI